MRTKSHQILTIYKEVREKVFEVFKAQGELSLAPIPCFYYDIFPDAVEEWISFIRPKTIANGTVYCHILLYF